MVFNRFGYQKIDIYSRQNGISSKWYIRRLDKICHDKSSMMILERSTVQIRFICQVR